MLWNSKSKIQYEIDKKQFPWIQSRKPLTFFKVINFKFVCHLIKFLNEIFFILISLIFSKMTWRNRVKTMSLFENSILWIRENHRESLQIWYMARLRLLVRAMIDCESCYLLKDCLILFLFSNSGESWLFVNWSPWKIFRDLISPCSN